MNKRTLRQLERLELNLWHLQCDVRFVTSLVDTQSTESLQVNIDVGVLAVVLRQFMRELRIARGIAQCILDGTSAFQARTKAPRR